MDVKIALALEIKNYRVLLEDEENRVGSVSLVIASVEPDGSYFKIRNGSTETVELKGWSLRSRETGHILQFPDRLSLRCGEYVAVFTGRDSTQRARKGDIAWDAEGIWDPNGDSAQLVSPELQVVHDVAVSMRRE